MCPQCGSAGGVHSVDDLAAMARARLGQFGLGYQGPPQGYQQPPGYQAPPPGYQPPPGAGGGGGWPAAPATTAAGLFGLGAASGLQRAEASQPVVQRKLVEQLVEQQ